MTLTYPDFTLDTPNPNPAHVTDAMWWFWLRLHELEPKSLNGGIYGEFKSGFHTSGRINTQKYPGNYSVKDPPNHTGPWWWEYGAAQDWTFPDAQKGDFRTINRYTQRLMKSAKDKTDPRLDMILFEFYGNDDTDRVVEGYNEYREELATSDISHLWHIHLSYLRNAVGNFWAFWALLTVLMGWTVAQWKASLTSTGDTNMKLIKVGTDYCISRNDGADGRETVTGVSGDIGSIYHCFVQAYPGAVWPDADENGWPKTDVLTLPRWNMERVNYVFGDLVDFASTDEDDDVDVDVTITQEQINSAVAANIPALAKELAAHFKVV